MRRAALLLLFAGALSGPAPEVRGARPSAPAQPRFTLTLTRPMLAGGVKLEPGEYDVAFRPAPAGMPHFLAVFSRGGVAVATAPAELKGATAGFKVSNVDPSAWIRGSFTGKYARKDGSIHPATFDLQARSEKAFYEALLTESGMPEADAASKAPAVVTVKTPRGVPPIALPTLTPTPKK